MDDHAVWPSISSSKSQALSSNGDTFRPRSHEVVDENTGRSRSKVTPRIGSKVWLFPLIRQVASNFPFTMGMSSSLNWEVLLNAPSTISLPADALVTLFTEWSKLAMNWRNMGICLADAGWGLPGIVLMKNEN